MCDKTLNASIIDPPYVADTLPPNLLAGIGDIIVRWGRLQWQLANLVVVAFDIPKNTGLALTSGMDVGALCNAIRTLTWNNQWIDDDVLRKEISCLAGDVVNKAQVRNRYAHGVFGFDMDEPNSFSRYNFKAAKDNIFPSPEPLALEHLKTHAFEAQELVDRTVDLTVRLKGARTLKPI